MIQRLLALSLIAGCAVPPQSSTNSTLAPFDTGGGATSTTGTTSAPSPDVCTSGNWWTGGSYTESPLMDPGQDCIECHQRTGEGPRYGIAGTVYTDYNETDDCYGVNAVKVQVTDAVGTVFTATSNSAGNFFLSTFQANPVFPITALVRTANGERAMTTEVNTGSCASCHTAEGLQNAPGRIIAP